MLAHQGSSIVRRPSWRLLMQCGIVHGVSSPSHVDLSASASFFLSRYHDGKDVDAAYAMVSDSARCAARLPTRRRRRARRARCQACQSGRSYRLRTLQVRSKRSLIGRMSQQPNQINLHRQDQFGCYATLPLFFYFVGAMLTST